MDLAQKPFWIMEQMCTVCSHTFITHRPKLLQEGLQRERVNQRIESIFLVQWHALYSCKAQTNAYLITRNFFIVLKGFFPNKFAEKIIIFNEFFISLHASHSLPRYALCCLVSDFLLRILNSGVEVTLLQQLGWINLCELAFYIYIYIYIFFLP